MNTIRQIKKALLIALLLGTASQSQAAEIPEWIGDKVIKAIEGAVFDQTSGHYTRPGKSVAAAGHVEKDYAYSVGVYWYGDRRLPTKRTRQENHLQGEVHTNGGHPLKDRRFAIYDYEIRSSSGTQRIAGEKLKSMRSSANTHIEGGTAKWTAKYVAHTTYSCDNEALRRPAEKFNMEIEYKLADLTYKTSGSASGIVQAVIDEGYIIKAERAKFKTHPIKVSEVQQDKVTNIDLLEDDTEIVVGPTAYGKCTRTWKLVLPSAFDILATQAHEVFDVLINGHEWEMVKTYDYGTR